MSDHLAELDAQAVGSVGGIAARRKFLLPLALAQFICSFAGSNMNVMINDITRDLDTTVTGVQAAITLFLLIMAILMIPCSKLSDRWGRKRCFNAGLVLQSPDESISPYLAVALPQVDSDSWRQLVCRAGCASDRDAGGRQRPAARHG